MGHLDRQIANALDRVHRELTGTNTGDCRWYHSGHRDIYHCPHTAVHGRDLMAMIPAWNTWNSMPAPAKVEWDQSPDVEHEL